MIKKAACLPIHRRMKHRLILKQQQESPQTEPAGEDLSTPALLTMLGCSGILALNDFSLTGHQWLPCLTYLMSLAMIAGLVCQMKSRLAVSEDSLTQRGALLGTPRQDERTRQIARAPMLLAKHRENYKTRVEHKSEDVLAIEPCLEAHYLAFVIASVVSLSVALMLLADWLQLRNAGWLGRLERIPPDVQTALVLVGFTVVAVIINQLRKPACRLVFDKTRRVFWFEHILIFNVKPRVSAQMPIAHVIAIQQLDKTAFQDNELAGLHSLMPFHTSYDHEINIVLKNNERINVPHTTTEGELLKGISQLSDFLGVPVWVQKSVRESRT